mmetsp:Transcript_89224/g.239087  ORF Transcript_89224/g.239087 Transcript_89224/m.239087 type:complete len:214 (-) Transcript_89224:126-767(-)
MRAAAGEEFLQVTSHWHTHSFRTLASAARPIAFDSLWEKAYFEYRLQEVALAASVESVASGAPSRRHRLLAHPLVAPAGQGLGLQLAQHLALAVPRQVGAGRRVARIRWQIRRPPQPADPGAVAVAVVVEEAIDVGAGSKWAVSGGLVAAAAGERHLASLAAWGERRPSLPRLSTLELAWVWRQPSLLPADGGRQTVASSQNPSKNPLHWKGP